MMAALGFGSLGTAQAKVTIQFYLGELNVPDGTVGILVADTGGNGFTSPSARIAAGTVTEVGAKVGGADDVIIGVIQAQSDGFATQAGFVGVIAELDYNELQLAAGQQLTDAAERRSVRQTQQIESSCWLVRASTRVGRRACRPRACAGARAT